MSGQAGSLGNARNQALERYRRALTMIKLQTEIAEEALVALQPHPFVSPILVKTEPGEPSTGEQSSSTALSSQNQPSRTTTPIATRSGSSSNFFSTSPGSSPSSFDISSGPPQVQPISHRLRPRPVARTPARNPAPSPRRRRIVNHPGRPVRASVPNHPGSRPYPTLRQRQAPSKPARKDVKTKR